VDATVDNQLHSLEQRMLAHSDNAPWTALLMVNPETGEQENCGVIIEKRLVAENAVWLTYSKADHLWWIVWQDDHLRKWGYNEERRKVCWRTFFELTEFQMQG
jgi:hypothetical protein